MMIETKICSKCLITKSISKFYKNKQHKDDFSSHCKECHSQYYQRHQKRTLILSSKSKRCTNCGKVKDISEFQEDFRSSDGFRNYCRTCTFERRHGSGKVKSYNSKYKPSKWRNRKEYMKEYNKKYYIKNRGEIKKRKEK